MQITTYEFDLHGDERGELIALEELSKDVPFDIKRVYYMYNTTPGFVRGRHAHRKLEQILICVHGSCKILLDDATERRVVTLDKPNLGLHISNYMWREMFDFSPDAVLLVLASEHYNEADYIRDYEEFFNFVEKYGHNKAEEG